ncbi:MULTISPECIES: DUF4328 domain-containing protein [Streptomyces]|uniref:DUF4328 domain-containing protein n=1 Tax=Streptomyces venezuelae TaxID=54571 RepID=A0A5P2AQ62_STRVZ|nr:DUF4328 domain-containing protein [Streptomyces venezuelae]QES20235.1 hypothetical protein DEJ46_14870 [Streptomyces venezuelae]
MLRNPNGLSHAVVALLGATILADAFSLIETFGLRSLFAGALAGHPDPEGYGGELALTVAWSLQALLLLATATVFIVWFHRLRMNAEVWASDLQRRKPGWAIGGWFIPIAFIWIPYGVAADIWRASRRDPYAADGEGELLVLNAWWTVFLADLAVGRIGSRLFDRAETAEAYVTAANWLLVGDAVDIVAAVLAILFVRRLTSMQHTKATGMIPAAQ